MAKSLALAVCAALMTGAVAIGSASAAPVSALPPAAAPPGSVLEPVHYRPYNRCRAWRYECARRWGWNTWRYWRCLRLHGCR